MPGAVRVHICASVAVEFHLPGRITTVSQTVRSSVQRTHPPSLSLWVVISKQYPGGAARAHGHDSSGENHGANALSLAASGPSMIPGPGAVLLERKNSDFFKKLPALRCSSATEASTWFEAAPRKGLTALFGTKLRARAFWFLFWLLRGLGFAHVLLGCGLWLAWPPGK